MSPPLIQVTDLTKVYTTGDVEVRALAGVSLTIDRGEFVAIMGSSGSGKSTLMNILGCLDHPTRGRYLLAGEDVSDLSKAQLAHIRNRDILIGSVAAAVATGISAIANMAMFAGMFGGDDEDRPNPVVVLLLALVAPIAASIMQMALSRSREYEADRVGAELTGDPRPLARALAKLDATARRVPMEISPAQATAYIVNPLTGRQVSFARLFLTHPPIEDRIARLVGRAELVGA